MGISTGTCYGCEYACDIQEGRLGESDHTTMETLNPLAGIHRPEALLFVDSLVGRSWL